MSKHNQTRGEGVGCKEEEMSTFTKEEGFIQHVVHQGPFSTNSRGI